jgi:hypothetical protein
VDELAPGLWSWTAPHPEWQPGHGWDEEVRCFAVEAGDVVLVIDPLLRGDEDAQALWALLDRRDDGRIAALLTCAAHVRSAGAVAERYGAEVWGHEAARPKVGAVRFRAMRPGDRAPGGAHVLGIDEPDDSDTPLYLPSHRALAVGDTLISVGGELRVWWVLEGPEDERLFRERYLPTMRGWLDLDIERVLVAHGEQLDTGREEVAAALDRPPYETM